MICDFLAKMYWYKDVDDLPMCLIIMWLCKCAKLTCVNWNERTILMQFLLSYDYYYISDRPYDLNSTMMINNGLNTIKKGL